MAASDFPTISRRPDSIKRTKINPSIRSRYQQGPGVFRLKYTASKKSFEVHWPVVTETEKDSIQTHFDTYQATAFTFTDPIYGDEHDNMVYTEDELIFNNVVVNGVLITNYHEFTLKLIEV